MIPSMQAALVTSAVWLALAMAAVAAETPPAWDDTREAGWDERFARVEITSSSDGSAQHAMWHAPSDGGPRPLIVSLHTWSGDFRQHDPLAEAAASRRYYYIHPDFRGRNTRAAACGSALVVADIDDAIDFALARGRIDRTNIHVIGVSGGGHAAMLTWMRSRHEPRSISAWVGISDLVKWHRETTGRGLRYATDLCLVTTGTPSGFDPAEARARSPLFMDTPVARRGNTKLLLHAGVHDGYTGSVPITQTIDFFNKVVGDLAAGETGQLVPAEIAEALLRQRCLPTSTSGDRPKPGETIYERRFGDRIVLDIFEGGHEMLVERALDHIPSSTILAIGDSNGAAPDGWIAQLRDLRFGDVVLDASVPGKTIGFDNLGNPALNTLRGINACLDDAIASAGRLDRIVILLGTNDCKAEFAGLEPEVLANMEALVRKIRAHPLLAPHPPRIVVVSPPPMGPDPKLAPKYAGGCDRVARFVDGLRELASRQDCAFVDIHAALAPTIDFLSDDGVHLGAEGSRIIARMISEAP